MEVCPAEIPLPDLLRDLRAQESQDKLNSRGWRWGVRLHALIARMPGLYQWGSSMAIRVLHRLGRKQGALSALGIDNGWTRERDFPAPQSDTFMRQWKRQERNADD